MNGDANEQPVDRLLRSLEVVETIVAWSVAIMLGLMFWIVVGVLAFRYLT